MKIKIVLAFLMACIVMGCASPEERATGESDSTAGGNAIDGSATDTVTYTGTTSGDKGTRTDTTDTRRQKATRQAGRDSL